MIGMSRITGRPLPELEHLTQSLLDLLTTPIGTRVLRRDYGSRLPELLDAPLNDETLVDIYAATADAIRQWEPRLNVQRVQMEASAAGVVALRIDAEVIATAEAVTIPLELAA